MNLSAPDANYSVNHTIFCRQRPRGGGSHSCVLASKIWMREWYVYSLLINCDFERALAAAFFRGYDCDLKIGFYKGEV